MKQQIHTAKKHQHLCLTLLALVTQAWLLPAKADEFGTPARTETTVPDKNNAVTQAEDGFGNQAGKESIGIYSDSNVRGFSPGNAGNLRIEGMYFDKRAYLGHLLLDSSKVRIGTTVTGYPFPAPTGIVDYQLRKAGDQAEYSYSVELENSIRGAGDRALDVNALLPLTAPDARVKMGMSVAASAYKELTPQHEASYYRSAAIVGHIRSADQGDTAFELLPFYSHDQVPYETPHSYWYVPDGKLPPAESYHIANKSAMKADWMRGHGHSRTLGIIYQQHLPGQWLIKGSLIRSAADSPRSETHVIEQLSANRWQNSYYSEKNVSKQADSAELRLSKTLQHEDSRQQFHLVWRGRRSEQRYGGEAYADLGTVAFRQQFAELTLPATAPDFQYGERSLDRVRQNNLGLAYEYKNARATLNLGLMKSYYDKQTWTGTAQERSFVRMQDQPLLGYWNLSLALGAGYSLYGGQTQGLEESGVAPVSASNRFAALPAIHTSQKDAGLRWKWQQDERSLNAVLGYFEVSKPHYGFNSQQVYVQTGQVQHRGLEGSIAGNLTPHLNLVMAAVYLDARVNQPLSNTARVRPVASVPLEVRSYLEYSPPQLPNSSADLGLQYTGPQTSSESSGSRLDKKVLIQLGLRHQLDWGKAKLQLRFQVSNLFNRDTWEVDSDNTFFPGRPRSWRLIMTLTH